MIGYALRGTGRSGVSLTKEAKAALIVYRHEKAALPEEVAALDVQYRRYRRQIRSATGKNSLNIVQRASGLSGG
jgi:hypothetical protein